MPLKLSAVSKRVVAQGAGEVLLVLLMAVLDVLLQRCQTLVAPVAVGAGQQLGEGIWRSRWQVCTGDSGRRRGGAGGGGRRKGKGKRAKRSANQWQLTGGLPRVVWELSLQSAPHESHSVRLASAALRPPPDSSHTHLYSFTCSTHTLLGLSFLPIVTNRHMILYVHNHTHRKTLSR